MPAKCIEDPASRARLVLALQSAALGLLIVMGAVSYFTELREPEPRTTVAIAAAALGITLVTAFAGRFVAGRLVAGGSDTKAPESGPSLSAFVWAMGLLIVGGAALLWRNQINLLTVALLAGSAAFLFFGIYTHERPRAARGKMTEKASKGGFGLTGGLTLLTHVAPLIALGVLWAGSPWWSKPTLSLANAKNVLLIGIDTLRWDHTSLSRRDERGRSLTPNIKEFSEDAVVFENAISQSPWTLPAFASIMTGRYPLEHGAISFAGSLRESELTISEVLREAGYRTGGFVSHKYVDDRRGFAQGMDVFEVVSEGHLAISSHKVSNSGLEFLERHRGDGGFFLFLHYFDPHSEYRDHEGWTFANDGYSGWAADEELEMSDLMVRRHHLDSLDVKHLLDLYDEEIAYTDLHIGRVLDFLSDNGIYDDTAVIVVADHGEEFMEHGWLGHTVTLYEEVIRVPLVARLPGRADGHAVVETPLETRSVFPTVLDYLGIADQPSPAGLQARISTEGQPDSEGGGRPPSGNDEPEGAVQSGRAQRAEAYRDLTGESEDPPAAETGAPPSGEAAHSPPGKAPSLLDIAQDETPSESGGAGSVFSVVWLPDAPKASGKKVRMGSVRKGYWKLISNLTGRRDLLFNLAADPAERRDLASSERERLILMKAELDAWLELTSRIGGTPTTLELTPEERKRLKALGYL
jgi:arylsulfatase A-like enzyme